MKITKRQLKRIIREEKRRLTEVGNQVVDVEMRADAGLRELLDAYLQDALVLGDLPREDALEDAFTNIREFVARFEQAVRYEEKNAEFRISESGPPGWGYQGNTGRGSDMEHPEKRNPRENISGSFGELLRMAVDAIHNVDGETDLAFDDLWNDPHVTGYVEEVLTDRGVEYSDEEISYLIQVTTDIAGMLIDGDYSSSDANRELSSEFDALSKGGWGQ